MYYAKDKQDGVYFTLPNGWNLIDQKTLNAKEAQSTDSGASERLSLVSWQEAFSLGDKVGASDVFSLKTPKNPLVYVRVRNLSTDETQAVSYNSLRDLVVPLNEWINKTTSVKNFNLSDDYEVVQKAIRGVRTIFSFTGSDGVDQTIDQTALVAENRTKIYLMLVRASTKDYERYRGTLTKIADSFTIRGNK